MEKQRKPRRKVEPWVLEEAKRLYATGNYSLDAIGKTLGYSASTIYYLLKKSECRFNHKWKHPMTEENRKKLSIVNKGKKISDAQRRAISERNSCNYNGMNGYGHTKKQNQGYVLAYAPKHPNAHADGYVMLHTIIMEQHIGRYLTHGEVVHHINHDKEDNNINNLQLMTKYEHQSMHMKERHEKRRNALSTAS